MAGETTLVTQLDKENFTQFSITLTVVKHVYFIRIFTHFIIVGRRMRQLKINQLTVRQKLGGPTHRVLLRLHKFRAMTEMTNDRLTITIFARKNLPAYEAVIDSKRCLKTLSKKTLCYYARLFSVLTKFVTTKVAYATSYTYT